MSLRALLLLVLAVLSSASSQVDHHSGGERAAQHSTGEVDGRKEQGALEHIRVTATREARDSSIAITLDTTILPRSGSWVTVSWWGVSQPQYDDWIAVYVPWDAVVSSTGPAKFQYASEAPDHMTNGSGSLRFKLINYRQDMRVGFMRGGLQAPVRVAVSEVLRVAQPNEPVQVHLALAHDARSMSVQWVSWNASKPTVRYGLEWDRLDKAVRADSRTYTREQMCGGLAATVGWVDPGLLHEAVLAELLPGRRYFYRVGDPAWGWSSVRSFLSPPRPGRAYVHKEPMRPAPPSITFATAAPASTAAGGHSHPFSPVVWSRDSTSSAAITPGKRQDAAAGSGAGVAGAVSRSLRAGAGGSQHATADVAATLQGHDGAVLQAAQVQEPQQRGEVLQRHGQRGGAGGGGEPLFAPGEPTVRVLMVGDTGQAEEDGSNAMLGAMYQSLNTTRLLPAEGPTFSLALHVGDLAYSRGYGTQWDNFMTQFEPIASTLPYMVLPGNHERDWPGTNDRFDAVVDSYGECGVSYQARTVMPTPGYDQMWYGFDHGPMHVLTYSTEHSTAPGSPQYEYIKADLAAVNRSVTPWLVVAGHRPLYLSTNQNVPPDGDIMVAEQLKQELEPLLLQYKVDLTLHGHHHTYQRTCPMANGACVGYDSQGAALGPVHLIIGHGGAGLTTNFAVPAPDYMERIILWWGYARMEVSRRTLAVEIISDLDGGIMDTLVLRKRDSTA